VLNERDDNAIFYFARLDCCRDLVRDIDYVAVAARFELERLSV
jgi:hypothetical protein